MNGRSSKRFLHATTGSGSRRAITTESGKKLAHRWISLSIRRIIDPWFQASCGADWCRCGGYIVTGSIRSPGNSTCGWRNGSVNEPGWPAICMTRYYRVSKGDAPAQAIDQSLPQGEQRRNSNRLWTARIRWSPKAGTLFTICVVYIGHERWRGR